MPDVVLYEAIKSGASICNMQPPFTLMLILFIKFADYPIIR